MTIGPEPKIRTLRGRRCSAPPPATALATGVLRPRAAFGVVLDAEHRQRAVTEAFDRSIVQVALRDVEVAGGDRGRIDLELVVLAGDVHTAGVEVLDRMVGAVVAVRKTRGGR